MSASPPTRAHAPGPLLCLLPPDERAGAHTLLRALCLLAADHPGLEAALAAAPELTGELRRRLEVLGLARQVRLAGPPTDGELRDAAARAALVLRPCSAHPPDVRTPAALAGVLGCPLPDPLPGLPPDADLPPAGAGLYVEAATPAGVAGAVAALLPGTR